MQIFAFVMCSGLMFLMGLVDDLYGLRARYKLFVQLILATTICCFGVRIDTISLGDAGVIDPIMQSKL